jgi:hypothetical protein
MHMPFVIWPMSFARSIIVVLLTLCVLDAHAQRIAPSRVAVMGNYWFGTPLTFDRASPFLLNFGSSGIGTSRDHSYGGAFEIDYDINPDWRFLFQAGLRIGKGEFTSEPFMLEDMLRTFSIQTDYTAIEFGPMIDRKITPWLDLLGGVSMAFYPSSKAEQLRMSASDTVLVAEGDELLSKPVHVSLPLGARLTIFQTDGYSVGFDLLSAINLTEAFRGYTSQAFRFGGNLWFAFGSDRVIAFDPIVVADTIFTPVKPRLIASARFLVNGRESDSILVTTIDTVRTTTRGLQQYVYFDLDRSTTTDDNELPSLSTDLKEIARRLISKPEAKLFIELHRNSGEASTVDQRRIDLFKLNFGHLKDRLHITMGKPVSGVAYATMRSDDPSIFLPAETKVTTRDRRVDHLSINRSTIAEAGISEWSVAILNGVDTLVHYNNATAHFDESEGFAFSIPANASRLQLHSYVIDRSGQRVDSYDTISVTTRTANAQQVSADEYTLLNLPAIPGQSWSYENSLLDMIVASVTPLSIVEVSNIMDDGIDDVTSIVSKIMEACRVRGVLPKKVEALPKTNTRIPPFYLRQGFANAVRVKVTTAY